MMKFDVERRAEIGVSAFSEIRMCFDMLICMTINH